jgi:hypothetical protein
MRRHASILVLFAILLALYRTDPAVAGPFEDATKAYERGDYKTASLLFNILAEYGNASAQGNLGVMYEQGQGVPKDYVLAYMWYFLAFMGAKDPEESNLWANKRQRIAYMMEIYQIADAQRLARGWKPKK